MPKAVSVVLAVFTAAFLIFAPLFLFPHIHDDLYTRKEEKKQPEYRGIMTLWNVSDDTAAASAYLNKAISRLEKNNIRVYIKKENMSPDAYLSRIKEESPDILCFSSDSPAPADELSALTQREGLITALYRSGENGGILYAVPFLLDMNTSGDGKEAAVLACYISIPETEDALKLRMCEKLIDILLSEDMQKSLIEENRIPVLSDKGIYETENDMTAVYDAAKEELAFKNVFE